MCVNVYKCDDYKIFMENLSGYRIKQAKLIWN